MIEINKRLQQRIDRLRRSPTYQDLELPAMVHILLRIGLDVEERVREERVRGIPELPEWITEAIGQ